MHVERPSAGPFLKAQQTPASQRENKNVLAWGADQITCNSKVPSVLLPKMLLLSAHRLPRPYLPHSNRRQSSRTCCTPVPGTVPGPTRLLGSRTGTASRLVQVQQVLPQPPEPQLSVTPAHQRTLGILN